MVEYRTKAPSNSSRFVSGKGQAFAVPAAGGGEEEEEEETSKLMRKSEQAYPDNLEKKLQKVMNNFS